MAANRLEPLTKEEQVQKGVAYSFLKSSQEDVLEAEFLMKFGFEGYWALYPHKNKDEGISLKEMLRLTIASRKVESYNIYRDAQSAFIGAVASNSKNPSQAFTKLTKDIIQAMKADQ